MIAEPLHLSLGYRQQVYQPHAHTCRSLAQDQVHKPGGPRGTPTFHIVALGKGKFHNVDVNVGLAKQVSALTRPSLPGGT